MLNQPRSLESRGNRDLMRDVLIIFAILSSLGFPGNFKMVVGDVTETLFEYGAFAAELAVMFIYSGDSLLDFKIIQLKSRNLFIYLMILGIFTETILVANSKPAAFITVLRFAALGSFALWMSDHFSMKEGLRYLMRAETIFVVFTLLFTVLKPGRAFYSTNQVHGAFRGLDDAKNSCGFHFSMMITMNAMLLKLQMMDREEIRSGQLLLLGIQSLLLVLCQATGALLTAAVAVVFIFKFSDRRIPIGWIYCLGNIGWLLFAYNLLPMIAPILEAMGKDATLTGRTYMWNAVLELMLSRNTLTGFGFGRFWVEPKNYTLIQSMFDENSFWGQATFGAHNATLELWLNVGLIGIALMYLAVLISSRKIRTLKQGPYMFICCILFFLFISGLTERIFDNKNYKTLLFFYALALGCDRPRKQDHLFSWQKTKIAEQKTESLAANRIESGRNGR